MQRACRNIVSGRHASRGPRKRCFKMSTSFSVIIPSYNRVQTIERTIRSVLLQNYSNAELIVIDGGSTDGTLEVLQKYASQIAYQVIEPDDGLYHAINKGINAATGAFVGVIATDDWYEPEAFNKIAAYLKEHPTAQWIIGRLNIVTAEGHWIKKSVVDLSSMPNVIQANHPTWFIRRDVYQAYGGYSMRYPIAADLDMLYRLWAAGVCAHKMSDTIANHSVGGMSTDPRNRNIVYLQIATIKYQHRVIGFELYVTEVIRLGWAEVVRCARAGLSSIKQKVLKKTLALLG